MFGKTHKDETKEKISKANKGKTRTPEQCKRLSDRMTGVKRGPFSEEHKRNISAGQMRVPTVKCPHCEVTGKLSIMKRWHFDKCKQRHVTSGFESSQSMNNLSHEDLKTILE